MSVLSEDVSTFLMFAPEEEYLGAKVKHDSSTHLLLYKQHTGRNHTAFIVGGELNFIAALL